MNPQQAIDTLKRLYQEYGHHNYGEAMSQVQHAVQAARLAAAEGHTDEVVLGAFFHDVGHLLENELGQQECAEARLCHQRVGAEFLSRLGFSDQVVHLVEMHVESKRYLTAIYPKYLATLSPASVKSLGFQGGPMNKAEVAAFERLPDKKLHVLMRHWDDQAKQADDPDRNTQPYFEMALRHLETQA